MHRLILGTTAGMVLVAHPALNVKSVRELVARAKAEPGAISYASSGAGGMPHLAGEMFKQSANIDVVHIPFKGIPESLTDVISGRVQFSMAPIASSVSLIKEGRLRALGVSSKKRSSLYPDLPTIAEQGYPGFDSSSWQGLFAPAKTPADVLDKIEAATKKGMKDPKWEEALARDGLEQPPERTRAEFTRMVADEHAFWGKKLKELHIEME